MTNQVEQGVSLSESVDSDKIPSPHWPKTLVGNTQIHLQPQEPVKKNRRSTSALSLKLTSKLTRLRQFL